MTEFPHQKGAPIPNVQLRFLYRIQFFTVSVPSNRTYTLSHTRLEGAHLRKTQHSCNFGSHFDLDWPNCEPEGSRIQRLITARYTKLYQLLLHYCYLAMCNYCVDAQMEEHFKEHLPPSFEDDNM